MSDDVTDKLPGIVFTLRDSGFRQASGAKTILGKVTLDCDVPDEETWQAVLAIFAAGHRMLSGELQDEYTSMLQNELRQLQERTKEQVETIQALVQKSRLDAAEVQKYKDLLGELGRRIREG